jgi:3-phenylpropionate/trans-cinnamate dioxygenase ferredoxin reductase component
MDRVVVIGGGKGGTRVAQELRALGHRGPVTIIDEDPEFPYDRPPLSKNFLMGKSPLSAFNLLPEDFFALNAIDLRVGRAVEAIDRTRQVVIERDGRETGYDTLVLAMGASARRLPVAGSDLKGVFYLRSAGDAQSLRAALKTGKNVLVIGGGFIGLEVAASAVSLGCEVTVVEKSSVAMGRAVPTFISQRVLAVHRERGVRVHLDTGIDCLVGDGHVQTAVLLDGTRVPCDVVVVGIGAVPRTALAVSAGLQTDNGIVVDAFLKTSDPRVYALGDVCRFPDPSGGALTRLESWRNADEQAKHVAEQICGIEKPYGGLPSFWSDQFDSTLQIVGTPSRGVGTVVRTLNAHSAMEFSLDAAGHIVGASAFGLLGEVGKEIRAAEHLIRRCVVTVAERLADPAVSLKSLLKN